MKNIIGMVFIYASVSERFRPASKMWPAEAISLHTAAQGADA